MEGTEKREKEKRERKKGAPKIGESVLGPPCLTPSSPTLLDFVRRGILFSRRKNARLVCSLPPSAGLAWERERGGGRAPLFP